MINYVNSKEKNLLQPFVKNNLERFGNCVIGKHTLKKLGESTILAELKRDGIDAKIIVATNGPEPTYIIEAQDKK